MIIERNITPYIVFSEDPVLTALHKISANGQRIIFLVNESGVLKGSLSDGDFRRWVVDTPNVDLETATSAVMNHAFTAAAARKATHEYGSASQPGAPAYGINAAIGGRLMVVAGGLPVIWQGEVVGGIGVSSGTPAQDQAVAQAGIDAWTARNEAARG